MYSNVDEKIVQYCTYLCAKVKSDRRKHSLRQVAKLAFENGMILDQLHDNQAKGIDFFVSKGISRGIAYFFVTFVAEWWEKSRICGLLNERWFAFN